MTEWRATVEIHSHDGEHMHVTINTYGESLDDVQKAAEIITKVMTEGRWTAMRVRPEGDHWRDPNNKKDIFRGYARFTFLDKPGETTYMNTWEKVKSGVAQTVEFLKS